MSIRNSSSAGAFLKKSLSTKISDLVENLNYANDESKVTTVTNSLEEIAAFIYSSSIETESEKLSDQLMQQIYSMLFNPKIKPYEFIFATDDDISNNHDDDNISNAAHNEIMKFLEKLQSLVKQENTIFGNIPGNVACSTLMKNIIHTVLQENRSDYEPLKILSLLFAICGLDVPLLVTAESCCNNIFKVDGKESDVDMVALSNLLQGCESHSQYFNLTAVPVGYLEPSDWLDGILANLLDFKTSKNQAMWLKCFRSVLKISVLAVENNIISIFKVCLFNIDVDSLESKQEYCNLFIDLISLHSRLHQLPKFFVKLLLSLTESIKENSIGKWSIKGQIDPTILKCVASHCRQLSFGQIIEIWKIFSETYTTFGNMSQVFSSGKGAIFFLAQLFSTFLLHAKFLDATTPSNIYLKYGDMILHTAKELKKNLSVLSDKSTEVLPLQQSFLTMCFALGETKLTYNACHEEHLNKSLVLRFPSNLLDCSLLLSFFPQQHTKLFELFLKSEDKVLSYLTFQLLIQKMKGLLHKKDLSEEEKTHLQLSISYLLQHASENISYGAVWDYDMCTLNSENYGTAIWKALLMFLPLVLNFMDFKDLSMVSTCFLKIMLQDSSRHHLKSIVLSAVTKPFFQNSIRFQTAFVASMWKVDILLHNKRSHEEMEMDDNLKNVLIKLGAFKSKWIKYAESTPKDNKDQELNVLWVTIKETCDVFNQLNELECFSKPKLKKEIFNVLELMDCLALDYLLPVNQVKCIVGLSTLFFLVPDSFNPEESLKVAEKISSILVEILDGGRSIWFFDFVASGPYLRQVVKTIERLSNLKHCRITLEWPKLLLDHMLNHITKTASSLAAAEDFFSEFVKDKYIPEVSFMTLLLMLKKLAQMLGRSHLNPSLKEICVRLASSSSYFCAKYLKKYEGSCNDSIFHTLIQCYAEIMEIIASPSCNIDQKRKNKCLGLLPEIITLAKKNSSDKNASHDVYFNFFTRLCKFHKEISDSVPEDLASIIWESVDAYFAQCSGSITLLHKENPTVLPLNLNECEVQLLEALFPVMNEQHRNSVLEKYVNQIVSYDAIVLNLCTLQMNLNVIRMILDSDSRSQEGSILAEPVLRLLSYLYHIVNQADDSEFHLNMLKIPVLQFINFIVNQKRTCVPKKSLIHCFHACGVVKLHTLSKNLPMFIKSFEGVWSVVYHLLVNHSAVVVSATPVFISFATNLFKSLVAAGTHENISMSDSNTQIQMMLCAQNMDRLLTVMARYKTDFAKLVPYLIADYIDCVQHITLDANIKAHLVSGINRLLDLCSEESLKTLAVNINHSCRDIYSNLVKNYKQYRYRGGV